MVESMSRYLVQIVENASKDIQYLGLGRAMRIDNATRYPHPSAAKAAGRAYEERRPDDNYFWHVIDTRTGERLK
jgi:hypothetical protein